VPAHQRFRVQDAAGAQIHLRALPR
jgi:hypothetical protein